MDKNIVVGAQNNRFNGCVWADVEKHIVSLIKRRSNLIVFDVKGETFNFKTGEFNSRIERFNAENPSLPPMDLYSILLHTIRHAETFTLDEDRFDVHAGVIAVYGKCPAFRYGSFRSEGTMYAKFWIQDNVFKKPRIIVALHDDKFK